MNTDKSKLWQCCYLLGLFTAIPVLVVRLFFNTMSMLPWYQRLLVSILIVSHLSFVF